MYVIFLHIQGTDGPGVRFANAADFLFEKRRQFADQNLFAVCRTPDPRDRLACK